MDPANHLKNLLQSQLATDASAIRYLPYCLSSLPAECLLPSSHLTKWTLRMQALLHSKDAGGRWAGLCLAHKTALLSQKLMIDSAQSWITIVLPMLSRNEPLPILKAATRLLHVIFTTAVEIPEFQRQVSVPNVVKFTHAVISLADNQSDLEVKIVCLDTLTRIIVLYPTVHRASIASLSALSLRYLNGSVLAPTSRGLMEAASCLYSALPLTGGKVGAINLWRKSLDETLAFGWEALHSLRTTFPIGQKAVRPVLVDDPQVAIPLNQDKLHCSVVTLRNLLSTTIQRPVQVPIGNLVKFIITLMSCSADGGIDGFIDPFVRSMEVSVVPEIWTLGCRLLANVAEQFPFHLDPHAGRLFSLLAFRLEQKIDASQRLCLLKTLDSLLKNSRPVDSSILPSRLAKSALYSITKILSSSREVTDQKEPSSSQKKNGKKRARNFEGDEVFKVTRQVVYSSVDESEALLTSIDVVQSLFRNPNLSSAMQSIIARLITSVLVALPRMASSALSEDPNFLRFLRTKIQQFSFTIGSGTTSVMSKTLPFLIEEALMSNSPQIQRDIGLLLHPRVPPLVRSMPHVEALSLFEAEESQEESKALSSLGMADLYLRAHQPGDQPEDVVMKHFSIAEVSTTENPKQATKGLGLTAVDDEKITHPVIEAEDVQTNVPIPAQDRVDMERAEQTTSMPTAKFSTFVNVVNADITPTTPGIIFPVDEEEDDEEMPAIDMASDSEEEED